MTAEYEPQPGDIGLVRVQGRIGALIRIGQWLNGDGWTSYEHAFVYVGDDRIVEAEPGGAVLGYLGEYADRPIAWLRCPDGHGPSVADAARDLIGQPYSWLDYAALAAHRLHIPVPGLRTFIGSQGHLICSQLCDVAASRGGWRIFRDGRWPGYVTPGALEDLAKAGTA